MNGSTPHVEPQPRDALASRHGVGGLNGASSVVGLTASQEAMLMGASQRGAGFEVQQAVIHLEPNVDMRRLRQAWIQVQRRHEGLRLRLDALSAPASGAAGAWEMWQPTQSLLHDVDLPFTVRSSNDLDRFLSRDRTTPLGDGEGASALPYRLTLLEGDDGKSVLVFTHHHGMFDGRSLRVVLEDVFRWYDGREWSLPSTVSFVEHVAAWGRRDRAAEREYFTQLLDGVHATHFPPMGRVEPVMAQSPLGGLGSTTTAHSSHIELRHSVDLRHTAQRSLPPSSTDGSSPTSTGTSLSTGQHDAVSAAPSVVSSPSIGSVIQAAWALVLGAYTHANDVVFGVTRSGRHLVDGATNMVGCLINTLPARVKLDPTQRVSELIESIHAQSVRGRPVEHASTAEIQSWLGVDQVLFNTLIVFERYSLDSELKRVNPGFASRRFELLEQSSFPMVLAAYQDGSRLDLALSFDTRRWSSDAMQVVLQRFASVVTRLVERPDQVLASIDLLLLGEAQAMRAFGRGPLMQAPVPALEPTPAPTPPSIKPNLAATMQVVLGAHGLRPAYLDSRGDITSFQALSDWADRWHDVLAADLTATRPADPAPHIVLALPRCLHAVALQWMCLRHGWVFVPVDPAWPVARITQVVLASKASVVVASSLEEAQSIVDTVSAKATVSPVGNNAIPVATSENPRTVAWGLDALTKSDATRARMGLDALSMPVASLAHRAAYTIFTSGSTGTPKGVEVSIDALSSHARGAIHAYELTANDRILQFASPAFDVALEEVWPSLSVGAAVVESAEAQPSNLDAWLEHAREHRVTVLNVPSAFFHVLMLHLESNRATLPETVRLVVIGSEKPSSSSIATFFELHRHTRLINAYGPTEATITCAVSDLSALLARRQSVGNVNGADVRWDGDAPVGKGLGESELLLLDPMGRLSPPGAPGIIHVTGEQVANGYVGASPEQSQRFAVSPFDPGRRMVSTGDLGRWRDDGELEFIGREDEQVKVRGVRVELGEIESALLDCSGVGEAAVVVRSTGRGNELVGFITSSASTVDTAAIKAKLHDRLPNAFVPTALRVLQALPLTRNGKVDRNALKRMAMEALADGADARKGATPSGDTEAYVANVFAALLDVPEIDVEASFFELGGHSLLAMRLLAQINRVAPQPITLATIFSRPSVRDLAKVIGSNRDAHLPTVIPLNARARAWSDGERSAGTSAPPIHFVCGVQLYAELGQALKDHLCVFGMYVDVETKIVEGRPLGMSVPGLARAYIDVLRQHQPNGPYLIGGVSMGGLLAYEMAQRLKAEGEEVQLLVLLDAILPRAMLAKDPLAKMRRGVRRWIERSFGFAPIDWYRASLNALRGKRIEISKDAAFELHRDRLFRVAAEDYDHLVKPYEGDVVIVRAREAYESHLETTGWDLGWSGLVPPETPVYGAEGTHLGILQGHGVREIARVLVETLTDDTYQPTTT